MNSFDNDIIEFLHDKNKRLFNKIKPEMTALTVKNSTILYGYESNCY